MHRALVSKDHRWAREPTPYFVEGETCKAGGEGGARRERCDVSAKYHPGEIEVQERASVRPMVEHLGSSIRPTIPPATREYSEERLTIVVGFVDADGRVWASLLVGESGFVRALDERPVRLRRHARRAPATRWRTPCRGQTAWLA